MTRSDRHGGRLARLVRAGVVTGLAVMAPACAVGPKYVPPEPPAPAAFKELGPWKQAEPADDRVRGKWWEVFGDEQLNALEEQLTVSNQTLRAAAANYQQARALVRAAESARMPQVGAGVGISENEQSENKPNRSKTAETGYTDFIARVDVAYEVDVWGRVRDSIRGSRAVAQASAADLESVNLSLHTELALAYLDVRALDAERQLIDTTVAAYERALALTRNRYQGGVASGVDVAQAETQLQSARAQAVDLGVRRAQLEHAIATLIGRPASELHPPAVAAGGHAPAHPGRAAFGAAGTPAGHRRRRTPADGRQRADRRGSSRPCSR